MVRVVVQARLGSSRLAGKALLPIGGYPSALLAVLRAANTGLQAVAAIPDSPSDDPLASALRHHDVGVVRGEHVDVLARFIRATADLSTDAIVVRLTADNVVPDGSFIERLISMFKNAGSPYLGTGSPVDGLPYGLSAEAFTVAALREADSQATTEHDREHVTPWLARRYGREMFSRRQLGLNDLAHLRCTLDSLDDYLRLCALFDGIDEPVRAPWEYLVDRLARLLDAPHGRVPYKLVRGVAHGTLALGTAQLGLGYGATNTSGLPGRDVCRRILREAVEHGVTWIDTARAYGDSETRVGEALARGLRGRVGVVTKLDPLTALQANNDRDAAIYATEASVLRSCRELQSQRLDVLLLHRWEHRTAFGGAIWERLLQLRGEGVIGALGASVYEPRAALEAVADPDVEYIQIPFNLLDWRWHACGFHAAAEARPDVVVHVRSTLLQGILAGDPRYWPPIPGVDAAAWVDRLMRMSTSLGRANRADLCMAYARSQPWVTSIVVGIETPEQLAQTVELFRRPLLAPEVCRRVETELAGAPEALLNPSLWKVAA